MELNKYLQTGLSITFFGALFPLQANAQSCEGLLERAAATVTETESNFASLDDQYTNECQKEYKENQKSASKGGSVNVKYGPIGGGASMFKSNASLSISLDEYCAISDSDKREKRNYREFIQDINPGYFSAYNNCIKNQGPLLVKLTNTNSFRGANVSLRRRNENANIKVSVSVKDDPNLICTEINSGKSIDQFTFPMDIDGSGFDFYCSQSEKSEIDGKKIYDFGNVVIATNQANVTDASHIIQFPASTYVAGKNLTSLQNDISALTRKNAELTKKLNTTIQFYSSEIAALKEASDNVRYWESEWIELKANETKTINHSLGTIPSTVSVWFADSKSPKTIHKMDPIYASRSKNPSHSYGTFVTNVTSNSLKINGGTKTSSSSYGKNNNHYAVFGESGSSSGTNARFIRVVFTAKAP